MVSLIWKKIDQMSSCDHDPEIEAEYLQVSASVLKAMSLFYKNEQARASAFLKRVWQLFPNTQQVSIGRTICYEHKQH